MPISAPSGCSRRSAARARSSTCAARPAPRPTATATPAFKRALAEYPEIEVVHEVFTGWQQDQGKQQTLDFIATGSPFDGVWTSGIDNVIVDALVESGSQLVPVVGADNAGFVGQLLNVEGLEGAAVTNPGSIGGAGVTLAVQILDGEKPAEQTVLVQPELWENTTEEGKAKLDEAADPSLSPSGRSRHHDPGLDDLHQGAHRRLQGSRRIVANGAGLAPGTRPVPGAAAFRDRSDLLLDASGVAKHYGAVAALRDASLSVRPGEVHALMGANGAGKSHPRQDPDRRGAARRRAHPGARPGAERALAGRRAARRAGVGLPGAGADPRPRRRATTCG